MKEMATDSSILGWKTSWAEEPGRLQSMESQLSDYHSHHTLNETEHFSNAYWPLSSCETSVQVLPVFLLGGLSFCIFWIQVIC